MAALTFKPHDPEDLADKMLAVCNDADLYKKLSAKSLERSKEFTWEKAARQYLEIYKKCL